MEIQPDKVMGMTERPDAPEEESESGTGVDVRESEPKLKHPRRYAVLLHNDDYTTMEFVVEVLQKFFGKSGAEATAVMLKVHQQGQGVAGVYGFDIAETKVQQVTDYARSRGFPLKCTMEEEDS